MAAGIAVRTTREQIKPIEEKLQSGLKTPPPSTPHGG